MTTQNLTRAASWLKVAAIGARFAIVFAACSSSGGTAAPASQRRRERGAAERRAAPRPAPASAARRCSSRSTRPPTSSTSSTCRRRSSPRSRSSAGRPQKFDAKDQAELGVNLVNDAISQGAKGIAITVPDQAIGPAVAKAAADAGIPLDRDRRPDRGRGRQPDPVRRLRRHGHGQQGRRGSRPPAHGVRLARPTAASSACSRSRSRTCRSAMQRTDAREGEPSARPASRQIASTPVSCRRHRRHRATAARPGHHGPSGRHQVGRHRLQRRERPGRDQRVGRGRRRARRHHRRGPRCLRGLPAVGGRPGHGLQGRPVHLRPGCRRSRCRGAVQQRRQRRGDPADDRCQRPRSWVPTTTRTCMDATSLANCGG